MFGPQDLKYCLSVIPLLMVTGGNSDGSAQPSSVRNHWDMNHIYGSGYMYLCASYYQSNYPEQEYQFFNRGISGNTLNDLKNRWKEDALAIHADVVSVLIGTNDVNEYLGKKDSEAFDFVSWEQTYRSLLDSLRQDNPQVKMYWVSHLQLVREI